MSDFEKLYNLSERNEHGELDKLDAFQHDNGPLVPYGAEEAHHSRVVKGCVAGCIVLLLSPFAIARGCEVVDRWDNPPQPSEAEKACMAEVYEQTPSADNWVAFLNELGQCAQLGEAPLVE